MLGKKYSADEFFESDAKDDQLEDLTNRLEIEILEELHYALEPSVKNIIQNLNKMEHNLKEWGPQELGEFSFRDDYFDELGRYICKLRFFLNLDVYIRIE